MLLLSTAFLAGLIFGFIFSSILNKIVKPGTSKLYFNSLINNIFGLFKDEEAFLSAYGSILKDSFRYAGLQLLGLFLALLPLIVFIYFIAQPILTKIDEKSRLTIIPSSNGKLHKNIKNNSYFFISNNGNKIQLTKGYDRYIICNSKSVSCQASSLLGFSVIKNNKINLDKSEKIIIRYDHNSNNLFWPYLNDIEFYFYLGLSIMIILISIFKKSKVEEPEEDKYQIKGIDYAFMSLGKYNKKFWQKVSGIEDKILKKKLDNIIIKNPIYITGLARSGTTILLEILSKVKGIATHRYRDFPFLMTPIIWNKFLSVFSSKQDIKERPHKDRIKINRESPEAFEEPIWEYFFPNLHNMDKPHILAQDAKNFPFDEFYKKHIKKILYLRQGLRYLSKGNYNILRIGYISKIYPDAKFIIPIRHPLTHIDSLVRQHNIFNKYAERDSNICEYLEAVGHYEFGPQRKPICVTLQGATRTINAWEKGDEYLGYAIQWKEIYGYVKEVYLNDPKLRERIYILKYEEICKDPKNELNKLFNFLDLTDENIIIEASKEISAPTYDPDLSPEAILTCWKETEEVASIYNYKLD